MNDIPSKPLWSQDLYLNALIFAARAHQGQLFPGTKLPYVVHLNMVCMEVMAALPCSPEADGDLAVLCALLHDTLEDTQTLYRDIREQFGTPVADGVLALTKDLSLPKAAQMKDSLHRIRLQPVEVWMVKLADRISNLQTPPRFWTAEKVERYREEALVIHDTLQSASSFLARRLREKIQQYPPAA